MLVALPAPSGSESSTSRKHCRSAVSQRTRPTRALDRQDRFRTAARLAHLHCLPVRRHVVELNLPRTRLRRAPRARSEVRGGGVGRAPTGQCGLGNSGELPRVPGSLPSCLFRTVFLLVRWCGLPLHPVKAARSHCGSRYSYSFYRRWCSGLAQASVRPRHLGLRGGRARGRPHPSGESRAPPDMSARRHASGRTLEFDRALPARLNLNNCVCLLCVYLKEANSAGGV